MRKAERSCSTLIRFGRRAVTSSYSLDRLERGHRDRQVYHGCLDWRVVFYGLVNTKIHIFHFMLRMEEIISKPGR